MNTPSASSSDATIAAGAEEDPSAAAELKYRREVEQRRRRALDLLLAGALGCALVLIAVVLWIQWQPREPLRDLHFLIAAIPGMVATIAVSYAAARWISPSAGSVVLLVGGVINISISDDPARLALGPALIVYSIPVMAAGMLLPPWSTFVLAGLSSLAVFLVSLQGGSVMLGVPAMLIFLMLALITWYFASSLEQSNRALNRANASLQQDIAERKRTQADLRLMSYIVQQSPVGIVLLGSDGRFEYANARFTEMAGMSVTESYTRTWADLYPADVPPEVNEQITASLAAGKPWRTLSKRTRGDGSWFWEEVSISPVRDEDAGTMHYLAISADVTANKTAEDTLRDLNAELERRVNARTAELQRANVALQHSARLKDEFLATMSHELRTPLTGVLGAADVLGEEVHGSLNARQQNSVRMIRESGRQLLALINGILDLSKIEAGGMELYLDTVDAGAMCNAAMCVVRSEAQEKGLDIDYVSTPTVLKLIADSMRLKQILVNLLSNAIKFTPQGGRIGVEVTGDAANEVVRFTVWDMGIGIAPEHQPLLFEPFVQLDSGLNRHYGGLGLGLALVRKFTELHGGGVAVESRPGAGSRFTVTLPWRAAEPEGSPAAPLDAVSATPRRMERLLMDASTALGRKPLILLAEDNRIGIEIVLNYLEPLGCELLVVLRGDDAVRAVVERRPDLVLMDIQMPHLDGIAAMRQIRSLPDAQTARTPIVALTALAMSGDRERCLAAGADDYLSKPFTLRALVEALYTQLMKQAGSTYIP